ncbi:uncharacterized protein CIMG_11076 [Coccidioides immitis RS]|uniref:Uncharacterized protein n=1 Tax=Coccidioides immitis (strain RS) TaxID=246410 RepID=A0A0D8JWE8_COCIM|nr:uncharacterized protein CIMG_11076 [Coccidioides immitis RS]KJF61469.1 hypothetical protein CIMG_11076 [Coccidioides immitis RS]
MSLNDCATPAGLSAAGVPGKARRCCTFLARAAAQTKIGQAREGAKTKHVIKIGRKFLPVAGSTWYDWWRPPASGPIKSTVSRGITSLILEAAAIFPKRLELA